MTQNNPNALSCATICWAVAALAGLLVAILLMTAGGYGFFASIFLGALVFIIGAFVLIWAFCNSSTASTTAATDSAGSTAATTEAKAETATVPDATTSAPAAASVASEATTAKADGGKVKASTALAGEADLASRKGEWKYDGNATPAGIADIPVEKPAAKKKPAAKGSKAPADSKAKTEAKSKTAAKKPAEKKAPAAKKPAAEAAAEAQPEVLTGPRDGGAADDLKQLKGVGPGLEKTLNELGFYHFDQVAAWKKTDIAWVDSRLKFKGRIERDDWVSQAKVLAKGGTTDFSKKVKKGGVY